MARTSLDAIMDGFNPAAPKPGPTGELKDRRNLTLWLPAEHRNAYDELQKQSHRQFGKHLREVIKAAIDNARAKKA